MKFAARDSHTEAVKELRRQALKAAIDLWKPHIAGWDWSYIADKVRVGEEETYRLGDLTDLTGTHSRADVPGFIEALRLVAKDHGLDVVCPESLTFHVRRDDKPFWVNGKNGAANEAVAVS